VPILKTIFKNRRKGVHAFQNRPCCQVEGVGVSRGRRPRIRCRQEFLGCHSNRVGGCPPRIPHGPRRFGGSTRSRRSPGDLPGKTSGPSDTWPVANLARPEIWRGAVSRRIRPPDGRTRDDHWQSGPAPSTAALLCAWPRPKFGPGQRSPPARGPRVGPAHRPRPAVTHGATRPGRDR